MTMLNGEPVDTGVPSTAPPAAPQPAGVRDPVAKLVGVLGLVFAFVFPPAGIVLGAIGRRMARRAGDRSGFATAALVLGIVFTLLSLLAIAAVIWFTVWTATAGFEYCVNGNGDGEFLGAPIVCE